MLQISHVYVVSSMCYGIVNRLFFFCNINDRIIILRNTLFRWLGLYTPNCIRLSFCQTYIIDCICWQECQLKHVFVYQLNVVHHVALICCCSCCYCWYCCCCACKAFCLHKLLEFFFFTLFLILELLFFLNKRTTTTITTITTPTIPTIAQ